MDKKRSPSSILTPNLVYALRQDESHSGRLFSTHFFFLEGRGTKLFHLKEWYKWQDISKCSGTTYRKDKRKLDMHALTALATTESHPWAVGEQPRLSSRAHCLPGCTCRWLTLDPARFRGGGWSWGGRCGNRNGWGPGMGAGALVSSKLVIRPPNSSMAFTCLLLQAVTLKEVTHVDVVLVGGQLVQF